MPGQMPWQQMAEGQKSEVLFGDNNRNISKKGNYKRGYECYVLSTHFKYRKELKTWS